jgi:Bacterial Ig domain
MCDVNGLSWMKLRVVIILCASGIWHSVQGQVANIDFYTTQEGSALAVAAPGVLSNDLGGSLTASLVSGPANGTLTFNTNGSFIYTPTTNFTGMDGFTYQAVKGLKTSSPASVDIMVLAPGELFHDDFARPTNDGSILPWTRVSGNFEVGTHGVSQVGGTWGITNALMLGTGTNYTYGYTYCGNTNWSDYSIQGQIRFSGNYAASAGLLGRLNPATGAHYAVWIYPEKSDEYNIPPVNGIARLWLYKYESWVTYTNIGQWSSLSGVGTNWHSLKLAFEGNKISSYFDGNLITNVTDNGSLDGKPAYTSGSMGLNLWISTVPYTFSVSNLIVTTINPVATNDAYTMNVATDPTLNVPSPGILTNDTGNGPLTAILSSEPASGSLTLTNNGGFSYTPTNGFIGTDSFTYQATDGQTTSGVATVSITVTTTASPPVITSINLTNGTLILTWTSLAEAIYREQYIDNLNDTNWNDVSPDVTATGSTLTETNILDDAPQRFYRVLLVTP